MKNIILIICFSFVVFSCSKDENNHEPKPAFPEHLIGKWKMTVCENRDDAGNTSPCTTQVTKNIYDLWFKDDGTYISKRNNFCEAGCKYLVEEAQVYPDKEGGFKITFKPDECNGYCVNWGAILFLNENELIISYAGYLDIEIITYTKVE